MRRFADRFRKRRGRHTRSTSPPAHYQYHCFVSYTTREDEVKALKPLLDEYVGVLQARGVHICPVYYDGWYLRREHYSRAELAHRLHDAIARSAFTAAFVSPGYVTSEWCCDEWTSTRNEHAGRAYPAQDYSILPLLWKGPLGDFGYQHGCVDVTRTAMVDITDHAVQGAAVAVAVDKTLAFLDA